MLLGRESERRTLDELLRSGRKGGGGFLVISGEAGVGKTAMLDYVLEHSPDYTTLHAAGVETESHISFSALSDLLRPVLDHLDELPERQSETLAGALGISSPERSDLLTLCSSVLGLLEREAASHPVLAVTDDAHLIDGCSAEVLRFVAPRLRERRIVMLFATCDGEGTPFEAGRGRKLRLAGLNKEAARSVLSARAGASPSEPVMNSLLRAAGGNPLALSEYGGQLSADRLETGDQTAPPAPGHRITEFFARRVRGMPSESRRALLLAAVGNCDEGRVTVLDFEELGVARSSFDAAEAGGLVRVDGVRLRWRHPLIRAAVYHGASAPERRAAHRVTAEAAGRDRPDQTPQLASTGLEPDERIAGALDRAADEARHKGDLPGAVGLREVAARLTPDDRTRARRLLEAAEAAALVGRRPLAEHLLEDASRSVGDPLMRLEVERIRESLDSPDALPSGRDLTSGEFRVARLVAQGLTNREVAEALFLSAKTVEFHLSNIYRKLGLRSRTELARRFSSTAPVRVNPSPSTPGPATPVETVR